MKDKGNTNHNFAKKEVKNESKQDRLKRIIKERKITKTISFSSEWDKLKPENFIKGRIFHTFRKWSNDKEEYYWDSIGDLFKVRCKNKTIGIATLFAMDIRGSDELTLETIKNDTYAHWGREEFENQMMKFYGVKNVKGIFLFFKIMESIYD